MSDNLYETLGVPKDASAEEIKNAYREKAKENHPDKFNSEKEQKEATDKMTEINHAYEVLNNPQRRERYDNTGSDSKPPAFEKKFQSMVDSLVLQIIEHNDVKQVDVIELIRQSIVDGLTNYKSQKKQIEASLNKLHMIKKRTKTLGDRTVIDALDLRISGFNNSIAGVFEEITFCEQCIEKMKDYSYSYDSPVSDDAEQSTLGSKLVDAFSKYNKKNKSNSYAL